MSGDARTDGVRRRLPRAGVYAVFLVAVVTVVAAASAGTRGGHVAAPAGGYGPVWSSDGTQLAYIGPLRTATDFGDLVPRHVEVVRFDGSGSPHAVAAAPKGQTLVEIRWAGSGRFVYEDSNYTLWGAVPGKAAMRLAIVGSAAEAFTLSRDGRYIAFTAPCECSIAHGNAVGIIAVAGGKALHLRRAPNELAYDPSFSPDGLQLVFSRLLDGKGEPKYPQNESLVVESARGGRERSLHVHGDRAAFSPDGHWIAFFGTRRT